VEVDDSEGERRYGGSPSPAKFKNSPPNMLIRQGAFGVIICHSPLIVSL
jgi:hypothetical protein